MLRRKTFFQFALILGSLFSNLAIAQKQDRYLSPGFAGSAEIIDADTRELSSDFKHILSFVYGDTTEPIGVAIIAALSGISRGLIWPIKNWILKGKVVCDLGEFKVINYPNWRSLKEIFDGQFRKNNGEFLKELSPNELCNNVNQPMNQRDWIEAAVEGHFKNLCKITMTFFYFSEETFSADKEYQKVSQETLVKIFGNVPNTCDEEKAEKVTSEIKAELNKKLTNI